MSHHAQITLADGSTVRITTEIGDSYTAMLSAIVGARRSILLAAYCMERGSASARFSAALHAAAGRGVAVRLMLDAHGSQRYDRAGMARLQAAGGQLLWRRPRSLRQLHRYNHGLHKKLLVVDGRVGFTGGLGIGDFWEQLTPGYPAPWRDTLFQLGGPVVVALTAAFASSWRAGGGAPLPPELPLPRTPYAPSPDITSIDSYPTRYPGLSRFGRELLALTRATRSRLTITTAYFNPSPPIIRALQTAARRGAQVRILTNGPYGTHPSAIAAGRHRYAPLLAAGIHIYEYQPTKIHTKAITSDGAAAIIGSGNLNYRSLYHDEEFGLLIRNRELAAQLDAQFARDLGQAAEIDPATWRHRPAATRLRQAGFSLARYIF